MNYIKHISEYNSNKHTLEPMCDLINKMMYWNLYTHIEHIYETFFIARLNAFGANLLILLSNESIDDSIDVIELVDQLSLCTYSEVMSLEFFSLETLFTAYFLQVHCDPKEIHSLLKDS